MVMSVEEVEIVFRGREAFSFVCGFCVTMRKTKRKKLKLERQKENETKPDKIKLAREDDGHEKIRNERDRVAGFYRCRSDRQEQGAGRCW